MYVWKRKKKKTREMLNQIICMCGEHKWLAIPQGQAGKSDMERHMARSVWCQMAKGGLSKGGRERETT